jgi:hypothetical protein
MKATVGGVAVQIQVDGNVKANASLAIDPMMSRARGIPPLRDASREFCTRYRHVSGGF